MGRAACGFKTIVLGDFPGDPVVKTLLSIAGGACSTPGQGARIPYALGPRSKIWNRSNIVTNPIKTLKMVDIKKNFF